MGSDVGRIVRAAGAAKDHERINFFFGRTHQDGTTVAACKFDGRDWASPALAALEGTASTSGAGTTVRVFVRRVGIADPVPNMEPTVVGSGTHPTKIHTNHSLIT